MGTGWAPKLMASVDVPSTWPLSNRPGVREWLQQTRSGSELYDRLMRLVAADLVLAPRQDRPSRRDAGVRQAREVLVVEDNANQHPTCRRRHRLRNLGYQSRHRQ